MSKTRRRRFPIVDPPLQHKLLLTVLIYAMTIVGFLAVFLFLPDVWEMWNENLSLERRDLAARRILYLHARVWPSIIAVVCVLGIHSIRVFHRLVGSLYRLRWAMGQIAEGNLSFRVVLRKKDHLQREREKFNQMMDVLEEKWAAIQKHSSEALTSLNSLEKSTSNEKPWTDAEQGLLERHRGHLEALSDASRFFRINRVSSARNGPALEKEASHGSMQTL
jgi:methyl-accepting chemotaxis protein